MAAGLFALFDDVAAIMDDVAVLGKVAIKKSAGVTGDDFAVSAGQCSGLPASREIPVLWKITKGSLVNKAILTVVLLLISYFAPIVAVVMLGLGACYIAYEGAEKVLEWAGVLHGHDTGHEEVLSEDDKVKSALRTDMVLSTEIMIITLAATGSAPLLTQALILVSVGIFITFLIYGIVTLLVRLDDMGLALTRSPRVWTQRIGEGMITAAPKIMRALSVIGTVAIFMVAGGIFMHTETVVGFISGTLLVGLMTVVKKIRG